MASVYRNWRAILIFAAAFFGGAAVNFTWAQKGKPTQPPAGAQLPPGAQLPAEAFMLVDKDSHVRGRLCIWGTDNTAALILCDQQGAERARLEVTPDGTARLTLKDTKNHTKVISASD